MKGKKLLRINTDELCAAMEDSSYEHEYYLNLETGEILFISDYMDDEESGRLRNNINEEPDRYERIPRVESHRGYEDMEDFVATVEDEQLAELLEVAINGRGAFRRFKDVLAPRGGFEPATYRLYAQADLQYQKRRSQLVLPWIASLRAAFGLVREKGASFGPTDFKQVPAS